MGRGRGLKINCIVCPLDVPQFGEIFCQGELTIALVASVWAIDIFALLPHSSELSQLENIGFFYLRSTNKAFDNTSNTYDN